MPCYAICMSGGYRDDVDEGLLVNYTGEGGQKGGKQVSTNSAMSHMLHPPQVSPSHQRRGVNLKMHRCCKSS